MRSKTSFFNKTLFQKNLSRYWPLWGLASFVGALLPLTILMQMIRQADLGIMEQPYMEDALYTTLAVVVPVISLLYAVLCAAAVWSYLYNARSTGMMHRLPIRREGLFVTGFLSGMAMLLIPYVITGALTVLAMAVGGSVPWEALLVTILGVLGESFFYFSSATFVAFLTGNVFAMPVLYFLLHFLHPLVMFLLRVLQSGFYYGVPATYSETAEWLSPTVYLMKNIQTRHIREPITQWNGVENYTYDALVGVELEKAWLIGVYALVGVVLLALAYVLYRRRQSEGAGDVAGMGWMRPVFRYAGALLAGVGGGMLLYALVWRPFQQRYDVYELVPLIVCMVITGLMGYYGISMLLEKSLKVFRGSVPGAAATAVVLALLCCAVSFDAFGVEKRVPALEDIQTVDLWVDGESYSMTAGQEDALIAQAIALHQAIVDDLDRVSREEAAANDYYTHVNLNYHLTDGELMARTYDLFLRQEMVDREGTVEAALVQLVNGTAAKLNRLYMRPSVAVTGGSLHSYNNDLHIELLPSEADAIRSAVARDAEAGTWGDTLFGQEKGEEFASAEIWLEDKEETKRLGDTHYRQIYLILRPEMTETIAAMRARGLLAQDSLQLKPREGVYDPAAAEVLPETMEGEYTVNGETVEKITVEEAVDGAVTGSLGVIGGADGPTQIYVTTADAVA